MAIDSQQGVASKLYGTKSNFCHIFLRLFIHGFFLRCFNMFQLFFFQQASSIAMKCAFRCFCCCFVCRLAPGKGPVQDTTKDVATWIDLSVIGGTKWWILPWQSGLAAGCQEGRGHGVFFKGKWQICFLHRPHRTILAPECATFLNRWRLSTRSSVKVSPGLESSSIVVL